MSYDGLSCEQQFKSLSAVRNLNLFKTLFYTWDYIHRLPILSSSASDLHARCCIPTKVESTRQNHQKAIIQGKPCTLLIIIIYNTLVNHLSDFPITLYHFTTHHIKIHYMCQHMEIINRNIFVGAFIGNLYDLLDDL